MLPRNFPRQLPGVNVISSVAEKVRLNRAYEFISHYTFDFLNLRNLFIICIYAIYLKLYISSFYIISLILSKIRIPIGTRLRIDILRNLHQFVLFAISKILQSEWTPISLRFLRRGKYRRTQRKGYKSVKWQLVINRSFSRRINNRCGESNELPHLRFGGRGGMMSKRQERFNV